MPNHVTNRIKITGDPDTVKHILNKIKSDEFGVGTMDFEKIIPMPENIFRGNLGLRERKLYGKNNWYDWSVANWGTKWNAYGFDSNIDYSKEKEIRFLSAWSAPHPVIARLAEMFPSVKFEHKWADEDIGMNCGRRVYYDGERIEEYYPESEKDRLEFAARVMDVDLELDYSLYLNASKTGYINIEGDDEYELIELFGQPALFTNERITDADVPNGMHCYHIRHGNEVEFSAIEKRIAVNHAGSVVTREPIDLGEQGYISFTDETSPNFTGEVMSLYEFREYDPEQLETEDLGMEMS